MIPLIEAEVVVRHKWLTREQLLDLIAVAQSCPGVFAVNIAIYIGYQLRGFKGALSAALGCTLPSFLIILAIAVGFHQFQDNPVVERIFRGIRPCVVALIAVPVITMAKAARITWTNAWIPIVAALLIYLLGVNPIYIILAALLTGYLLGRFSNP